MTACQSSQYKISLRKPVGGSVKIRFGQGSNRDSQRVSFHLYCGKLLISYLLLWNWIIGVIKQIHNVVHCSSPHSTTLHILNACPSALSKGRYTWRHDSVLCQILDSLSLHLSSLGSLYGDIDGYRAIENPVATIPLDILVTSDCPDIVFISKDNSNTIIELHSLQCSRIFGPCSCSQN